MNRLIQNTVGTCHDPSCQLCCGSTAIEDQSAVLWDYLEKALDLIELERLRGNLTPLKLAIVGRDPYPKDAIGIPFAKPTIPQTASSLSGGKIFQSLGIDVRAWRGKDIRMLFEKLLKQRIVFLNASYVFLGKGPLAQGKHGVFLHCANTANSAIINNTEQVVLCGEATKGYKWANGLTTKAVLPQKFHSVPHPSAREYNRNETEFQKYWAPGALFNMFGLQNEILAVNRGL
jgi:uracil DNA glycosylase